MFLSNWTGEIATDYLSQAKTKGVANKSLPFSFDQVKIRPQKFKTISPNAFESMDLAFLSRCPVEHQREKKLESEKDVISKGKKNKSFRFNMQRKLVTRKK